MNNFEEMSLQEIQEVEGGISNIEIIFGVVAVYAVVREVVRDAGRRVAYKELEKKR